LNIKQYKLLCDACDQVINEDKNLYRVSIPWLHVLREHPASLRQYECLFNNNVNDDVLYSNNSLLVNRKRLDIFPLESHKITKSNNSKDVDVVIVSHIVNVEHLDSNEDFYFGDIPQYLINNRVNPLVVLINHTNEKTESLSKKAVNSDLPRIILPKNLSLIEEMHNIFGLIREMLKIRLSSFREKGLLKQTMQRASSAKGLGGALSSLRINRQIKQILKLYNPKVIITTYEGHSWERVVYGVVNRHNDNILRIAYQHSVITKNAHSIFRSLGKKYDPDLIFTSGFITKNFFQKSPEKMHSRLEILGSKKSSVNISTHGQKKRQICLVLPEGIIDECITLFNFSIKCANFLPHIDFIWRLHPVISFKEVLRCMGINSDDLPKNIVLSSSSLSEDIIKSNFALYRGTTAIIEAIYGGLMPIYLADDSGMTIDLLFEIDDGKAVVRNVNEFSMIIKDNSPFDNDKLVKYCESYFTQIDYSALLNELKRAI